MTPIVREVRVGTTSLPLPEPLRIGPMLIREREYAAVEVETDDGRIGSAYCLTRGAPVAACVERLVAPLVIGRLVEPVELWEECSRATVAIGRSGLVVRALGLVDIALWDLAAQQAGAPLWRHLGGSAQTPPRVPTMMVAAYPDTGRSPESLAEDVVRYASEGYPLLKLARDAESDLMRRLLERAADGLPPTARLVVDAGFGWRTAEEALAELPRWNAPPLAWLEDPLVPEDAEGCAAIRRACPHPLGVGDEVTHIATYRALLAAGAIDVLRLDLVAVGGITPARHVLALAADHDLPVSLHVYPEVSTHVAAAHPGVIAETFDPHVAGGNPYDPAHLLGAGGAELEAGALLPTDAPGLGFRLAAERFWG